MSAATPIIQRFSLVFVSPFKYIKLNRMLPSLTFPVKLSLTTLPFPCIWTTDGVVELTINKLTTWRSTRREKLPQVVKNFPYCTEPKDSLPCLQRPDSFPYPEPYRSTPRPSSRFLEESILILSLHLHLILPRGFFPLHFLTKTICEPLLSAIRATCPVHLNHM